MTSLSSEINKKLNAFKEFSLIIVKGPQWPNLVGLLSLKVFSLGLGSRGGVIALLNDLSVLYTFFALCPVASPVRSLPTSSEELMSF